MHQRDSKGRTALFGAVFWGWNDVVRFLVDKGARLDVKDAQGRTLLDAALGRAAQGKGRGSQGEDPRPATAELLRKLMAEPSSVT